MHGESRCGRRHHYLPEWSRPGLMVAGHEFLDVADDTVDGLRLHGLWKIAGPGLDGGGAAAEHEANAEFLCHFEQRRAAFGTDAGGVDVVMVGAGRGAGEQQLGQPYLRGDPKQVRTHAPESRLRDGAQPLRQRLIDALRHTLDNALEEMMVSVDPAGIDHAAASVEALFFWQRRQLRRHLLDNPAPNADVHAAGAGGGTLLAGHHSLGSLNQIAAHGCRPRRRAP